MNMIYYDPINNSQTIYYYTTKKLKTLILLYPRMYNWENKTLNPLRKHNEWKFILLFITPTIMGLAIVTLIIVFLSILFPSMNWLVNNHLMAMNSSSGIHTNNDNSQPQRPDMNSNTNITHPIYWLKKSTRPSTTLFYTHHTNISKPRNSDSFISKNSGPELSL